MIVPFVFEMFPNSDSPFLTIFFKFLKFACKNGLPIIAQQKYLEKLSYFKSIGGTCDFGTADWPCYGDFTDNELEMAKKYAIPACLDNELVKLYGTMEQACIEISTNRCDILEKYLLKIFDCINKNSPRPIRAIITWLDIPSLFYIAEMRNFKIVSMELSAIRKSYYAETLSYFQFSNRASQEEAVKRFNEFLKNERDNFVPYLTRKEILALFLKDEYFKYIDMTDSISTYEMGIALDPNPCINPSIAAIYKYNNEDIINYAQKMYKNDKLLIRSHPAAPCCFNESGIKEDISDTSLEFILKCRRILTIGSNIGFEAMLAGRTSYVLGSVAFAFKALKNAKMIDESIVDIEYLNFLTFGFYVPFDIMFDLDYINWRLSMPNEIDIYMRHFNYYIEKRKIPIDVFNETLANRLNRVLVEIADLSIKNMIESMILFANQIKNENKMIIIWGAGQGGIKTLELLEHYGVRIHAFLDSALNKKDTYIRKIPVLSPDIINTEPLWNKTHCAVFIASTASIEIAQLLEANGWSGGKDYFVVPNGILNHNFFPTTYNARTEPYQTVTGYFISEGSLY